MSCEWSMVNCQSEIRHRKSYIKNKNRLISLSAFAFLLINLVAFVLLLRLIIVRKIYLLLQHDCLHAASRKYDTRVCVLFQG